MPAAEAIRGNLFAAARAADEVAPGGRDRVLDLMLGALRK
jgi:hypothetical protein